MINSQPRLFFHSESCSGRIHLRKWLEWIRHPWLLKDAIGREATETHIRGPVEDTILLRMSHAFGPVLLRLNVLDDLAFDFVVTIDRVQTLILSGVHHSLRLILLSASLIRSLLHFASTINWSFTCCQGISLLSCFFLRLCEAVFLILSGSLFLWTKFNVYLSRLWSCLGFNNNLFYFALSDLFIWALLKSWFFSCLKFQLILDLFYFLNFINFRSLVTIKCFCSIALLCIKILIFVQLFFNLCHLNLSTVAMIVIRGLGPRLIA